MARLVAGSSAGEMDREPEGLREQVRLLVRAQRRGRVRDRIGGVEPTRVWGVRMSYRGWVRTLGRGFSPRAHVRRTDPISPRRRDWRDRQDRPVNTPVAIRATASDRWGCRWSNIRLMRFGLPGRDLPRHRRPENGPDFGL